MGKVCKYEGNTYNTHRSRKIFNKTKLSETYLGSYTSVICPAMHIYDK